MECLCGGESLGQRAKVVDKIVPDTSVVVDGKISQLMEKGEIKDAEIVIPLAVLDELQAQASQGRETGFFGLNELKKIQALSSDRNVKVRFSGVRPTLEEIRLARGGRIDAIIMDVAKGEGAVLLTADYVQSLVAEAKGVSVKYMPPEPKPIRLSFEEYFTPETLSLHLKEETPPLAKRGKPGKLELVKVRDKPSTAEELNKMIKEIYEAVEVSRDGFVEISRSGASVIQLGIYRIAIARPPFSDGLEVTVVRPVMKLTLEDYKLSKKLIKHLESKAEGILIAGPPGSGKTTFASSLAEFLMRKGRVVKTLESPRDLQVGPEVTQYRPLEGSFEKTADILLLVRPDYTIFDEVRKTEDFRVFADMRLAGVGMIGVVHASDPIGAIQRFIGRVELGMIPYIVDTILFIRYGEITKVYELSLVVKVPTGMAEADLARPVVEVRDFESRVLEFEIYTFGEENFIIPVSKGTEVRGIKRLAAERILQEVKRFDPKAEVEVTSDNMATVRVENTHIPRLIGKDGSVISKLEEKLGIRIDVEPRPLTTVHEIEFEVRETSDAVELIFGKEAAEKKIAVYVDDVFLFSAMVSKRSRVKVTKRSEIGKELIKALVAKKRIKVLV
ncbi:MAG: PINc/VapC family ATPase [Candidatus Bathyarchaeia archaeon]